MENFRKKQMREQLTRMIGDSEAGRNMIEIILKANFEGYTENEIEDYKKEKEEMIAYFRERLDPTISQPVESKVVELNSINNVNEPTGIKTIRENDA